MRTHRWALASVFALAAPLLGVASAQAAIDTTPPTVTVPQTSSYIVGTQVGDPVDNDGTLGFWTEGVTRRFAWTTTDASGVCRYSVDEDHGVEGWLIGAAHLTHATSGRFTYTQDQFENSDDLYQIRINVWDCADNKTSVTRATSFPAIEKDYGPALVSGWSRTSCVCAMGDSMLRTSTYHAGLSTVVNGGGRNRHVALVMAKGPARGKAAIYFDGTYVKTVDTYASVNTNRVVMWDKGLPGTANHTIKVLNLGTSGRPRIDVDGYVR